MQRIVWALSIAALAAIIGCGGGDEDNFPALTPFSPELSDRLHQIRDRVSQIRGLPPYQIAIEGTVTTEALQAYSKEQLEAASEEDKARLSAYDVVLKMLGLIGKDQSLAQLITEGETSLIAGIYFPKVDRLALVAGEHEIDVLHELTLAHEYTHSLQDGAYDIEKLRETWEESDLEKDGYTQYSETLDCLIEGDAELTERLYAEQVFGADWQQKVAEAFAARGPTDGAELPPFVRRAFSFNYGDCPLFVQQLYEEGGWQAVNDAYSNPPATTEQILHVDKYKARELANTTVPEDLTEQLKDWEMLDSSQFGEFDVYNYVLTLAGDPFTALVAAQGWGSGWSTVYRDKANPARAVVQLSFGWDRENDLTEFLVSYAAILGALKAQVEPVGDKGDARWTAEGQFGALSLDRVRSRVEIRIATDADALKMATTDLEGFD